MDGKVGIAGSLPR